MDFLGKKCCKCNNILHADDDIVICPDCGAPYHRDCYIKEGKCVFKDKHKIGFEWKPEDSSEDDKEELLTKKCWRCGTANREDSMFCRNCGSMLNNSNNTNPYNSDNNRVNEQDFNQIPNPYGMPFTIKFDAMGGVSKDEDFGDNVSAAELAKLVKVNTPYYMREFKNAKDKKRTRFNFSAFLFSGGWLLYRKQYLFGAITTIITFILFVLSAYINYAFNSEIFLPLQAQYLNSSITYNQYIQSVINNAAELGSFRLFLLFVPIIMHFIIFIINIIIGFCGNKMYYKHCKNKIISIKSNTSIEKDEIDAAISNNGGVDTKLLILVAVCYLLIYFIL